MLARFHLIFWIISLSIAAIAGVGTVIAGIVQLIPPWWTIPAGLVALTIPIVALNQILAVRSRQSGNSTTALPSARTQPSSFPIRSAIVGLGAFLVIALPTSAYFLGIPKQPTSVFEDKRVPGILDRLAVLEKRSTAPIGPPGPRGPAGPQGPSGAPASDRRVGEMRNTLSALTAIMFAENGLPKFKTLAKGYNGFVQRILSYYKQPNFISPGRVMEKDVYHVAQPLQDLIRHDRSPIPRQNGSMKIFIINMRQIHRH